MLRQFNNKVRGTNLSWKGLPRPYSPKGEGMSIENKMIALWVLGWVFTGGFIVGLLFLVKYLFF
jgi:hypothetical protein